MGIELGSTRNHMGIELGNTRYTWGLSWVALGGAHGDCQILAVRDIMQYLSERKPLHHHKIVRVHIWFQRRNEKGSK